MWQFFSKRGVVNCNNVSVCLKSIIIFRDPENNVLRVVSVWDLSCYWRGKLTTLKPSLKCSKSCCKLSLMKKETINSFKQITSITKEWNTYRCYSFTPMIWVKNNYNKSLIINQRSCKVRSENNLKTAKTKLFTFGKALSLIATPK